jgi:predicted phosphohydrolase
MNDFDLIREKGKFTPEHSVKLHKEFRSALTRWFATVPEGTRVVVTHHVPVADPKTKFADSILQPAFVCTEMLPLIEEYQPDLWIYGHTHEPGKHAVGKTRLISNQLGYPSKQGGYECSKDFDKYGCMVDFHHPSHVI